MDFANALDNLIASVLGADENTVERTRTVILTEVAALKESARNANALVSNLCRLDTERAIELMSVKRSRLRLAQQVVQMSPAYEANCGGGEQCQCHDATEARHIVAEEGGT